MQIKNEYSSWHDNVWDPNKYKNLIHNNNHDNNNRSHFLWDDYEHYNRQEIFICDIGSILSCDKNDNDDDELSIFRHIFIRMYVIFCCCNIV